MYIRMVLTVLLLMLPLNAIAHEVGLHKEEPASVEEQHEEEAHSGNGEANIEEIIEHEFAPIRAELAEIHDELERPGLTEIVGGIGWIAGILGFIAYLKSRRKD